MWLVSEWGLTPFFIVLLLAVVYLVDFGKGFILIQLVSWNGIFTDILKASFALPRPDAVDSRVLLGGIDRNPIQFEAMGSSGFFEPLPDKVVSYYRGQGEFSYGFPSGHCSATTSTWGGIALLFREPSVRVAAVLMILLMPLSRMYLGRHFLADTLGGVTQGLLLVALAWFVIVRGGDGLPSLRSAIRSLGVRREQLIGLAYLVALPLAFMFLPYVDINDCARLLGVNLGWYFLARRGLPLNGGPMRHRLARFLLAVVCFVVVALVASRSAEGVAGSTSEWTESFTDFVATLATIWGATELSVKLGWFPGRASRP